jgi:hypothetical protein
MDADAPPAATPDSAVMAGVSSRLRGAGFEGVLDDDDFVRSRRLTFPGQLERACIFLSAAREIEKPAVSRIERVVRRLLLEEVMNFSIVTLLLLQPLAAVDDSTTQTSEEIREWRSTAETDVLALGVSFTGVASYSLHVGVKPPWSRHLLLGAGVFGAERLPEAYVQMLHSVNGVDNAGWRLGSDGLTARVAYYFGESKSGFYAALYLAWIRWHLDHPESGTTIHTNQLFLWPAAGYRWFPGGRSVFVSAFVSAAATSPIFGTRREGPAQYQELRWYPFAAVHVGYEL